MTNLYCMASSHLYNYTLFCDITIHTGNVNQNYHAKHGESFLKKTYAVQMRKPVTNEAYAVQVKICISNECHQKHFDNHLKNDLFVLHGLI